MLNDMHNGSYSLHQSNINLMKESKGEKSGESREEVREEEKEEDVGRQGVMNNQFHG